MRGGTRKNAGRKPVEIDVEEWEKLHAMHCSVEEIAGLYSVSTRTIETRLKQRTYAEAAIGKSCTPCIAAWKRSPDCTAFRHEPSKPV